MIALSGFKENFYSIMEAEWDHLVQIFWSLIFFEMGVRVSLTLRRKTIGSEKSASKMPAVVKNGPPEIFVTWAVVIIGHPFCNLH